MQDNAKERIVRKPELKARFGIPNSTLYEAINAGKFPAPIKLSIGGRGQGRSIGWLESEIESWLASRIAASRQKSK